MASGVARRALAFAMLLACCAMAQPSALPRTCPAWATEYAAWHKAQRRAADTPRLVLHCLPNSEPGGLGDHMRGVMFALRVSATHKRLLFLNWTGKFDLRNSLLPADGGVDWRLPDVNASARTRKLVSVRGNSTVEDTGHVDVLAALLNDTTIDVELCSRQSATANIAVLGALPHVNTDDLRCLWHLMFKPAERVTRRADELLAETLARPIGDAGWGAKATPVYVAVHLRLGGLEGETITVRYKGCEQLALFGVQACARELAANLTASSAQADGAAPAAPVLLVTDNAVVRHAAAAGALAGVVAPSNYAVHITTAKNHSDFTDVFADLALLARADCLVTSRSGYSDIALWWSRTSCLNTVDRCMDALKRTMKHSYVGPC